MLSSVQGAGFSAVHRLRQQLGLRLAKRLFDDMARESSQGAPAARRSMPASLAWAYLIAAGIHGTSLLFAITGATVLWAPWRNPFAVFGAFLLLCLAWACRPRFGVEPDSVLPRHGFPVLYGLADRLADAIGTPRVDGIELSPEFNASYGTAGWRGRRCMSLGLPLMAVLSPQERLAVMGHELAHGANGDPLRGRFLASALHTLVMWAQLVRPMGIGGAGRGMHSGGPLVSLLAIPFELAMLAMSELILLVARGMLLLVMRQSQRAEYRADALAARIVGAPALRSSLDRLLLDGLVEDVLRRHALTGDTAPLMPKFTAVAAAVSEADMQRWRERAAQSGAQADASHPPTSYRVAALDRLPQQAPPVSMTESESAALDAELARVAPGIERELVNRYMASLEH